MFSILAAGYHLRYDQLMRHHQDSNASAVAIENLQNSITKGDINETQQAEFDKGNLQSDDLSNYAFIDDDSSSESEVTTGYTKSGLYGNGAFGKLGGSVNLFA